MIKIVGIIKDDPITGVEYGEVTIPDPNVPNGNTTKYVSTVYTKAKQLQHARLQKTCGNETNKK